MQIPSYHPPSAAQWEEVLRFRELPILADTRIALGRALKAPQVSFESLVPVVESDPALCWHLLQSAAGQNPNCREQLQGAYSCLSLLGMQELVRLVKQLPVVSATASGRAQHYRQALITAHMAGCLAARWVGGRRQAAVPAYWIAMLSHSVIWPWLLISDDSRNWLHRLSERDELMTAAVRVFGDDRGNWQRLARRHHLPDGILELFEDNTLPDVRGWQMLRRQDPRKMDDGRRLMHQCQTLAMLALTAASMAWQLHLAPEGRRAWRWMVLSSHTQGRETHQVLRECRQIQLREAQLRGDFLAPGIGLLASPESGARRRYAEYLPVAASVAKQQPKAAENVATTVAEPTPSPRPQVEGPAAPAANSPNSPAQPGQAYLNQLLTQLNQRPDSFGDLHSLMRGVLKGISTGIGVQHACVLLTDKGRSSLRVVYSENPEGIAALTQARIMLNSAPVFQQLMKQNAAVRLTSANRAAYQKGMPVELAEILPEQMMLMSISAGPEPMGIILACPATGSAPVTDEQYRAFRQLCGVTSKGLASLRRLSAERRAQVSRSS